LASKKIETKTGNRWNPIVRRIANNLQQLNRAIAAFGRDDAEFGHMPRIEVHGVDESGAVVMRKRVSRSQVLEFFGGLSACLIGIEACSSAHYWSRETLTSQYQGQSC
jgi:hypothetical protein